jgi:hypothetical protein
MNRRSRTDSNRTTDIRELLRLGVTTASITVVIGAYFAAALA